MNINLARALALALLLACPAAAQITPGAPGAFYVATNGNDSNPGTLSQPFLTLIAARTAMRGSTTKTTYVRGGNYAPAADGGAPGTHCTGNLGGSVALSLIDLDSGETWSYYAPDGVNSAIIDGGASSNSTGLGAGICITSSGSNITINGLQFAHYRNAGISISGADACHTTNGNVVENNIVHDTYQDAFACCPNIGAVFVWGYAANATVKNNYVYNTTTFGISGHVQTGPGNISGLTVANNFVYNTCTGYAGRVADCGAIYLQDGNVDNNSGAMPLQSIVVTNNYVRDVGIGETTPPQARPLYLDDAMSNVSATGNILSGQMGKCVQIHGGNNNVVTGNLCDFGTIPTAYTLAYQTSTNGGPSVATSMNGSGSTLTFAAAPKYVTGFILADTTTPGHIGAGCTVLSETVTTITASCSMASVLSGETIHFIRPMTGNVVSGNIIINAAGATGAPGFKGAPNGAGLSPPNPQVSVANDFFTYGSTAPDHTGSGGAASDSSPQNTNPLLNCWTYNLANGGAVFGAPINFPHGYQGGIAGGWGPPGFVIPQIGTPPSSPHAC